MRELSFDDAVMEPDDEFLRMEEGGQLDDNIFDSDGYDYFDPEPDYDQSDDMDGLTYNGEPLSGLNVDHIIETPDSFYDLDDFDDVILGD